jgi:hypothetical protein
MKNLLQSEKKKFKVCYQRKSPIFWSPSKTKIPVGVKPREYSEPSLPWKDKKRLNLKC